MFYTQFTSFIASTVVTGKSAADLATETSKAVVQTAQTAQSAPGVVGFFSTPQGAMLSVGLMALAMYFLMILPQKKREKQIKLMQAELGVGDSIITSSGLYGVITAVYDTCFIVEFGTNKGVRIPIRKIDILGKQAPVLNQTQPSEVIESK